MLRWLQLVTTRRTIEIKYIFICIIDFAFNQQFLFILISHLSLYSLPLSASAHEAFHKFYGCVSVRCQCLFELQLQLTYSYCLCLGMLEKEYSIFFNSKISAANSRMRMRTCLIESLRGLMDHTMSPMSSIIRAD